MLNFFNTSTKENVKVVDGKKVTVKKWPVKENKDTSWGRCGYESLYK